MPKLSPADLDELAHLPPGAAEELITRLETLSSAERAVFSDSLAQLAKGRRLPLSSISEILPLIEKLNLESHVPWHEIFDEGLGAFRHRKLQEHYRRYLERKNLTEADVSPRQWALRTRGDPGSLFRLLMGDSFQQLMARRVAGPESLRKLSNIPQPAGLTDDLIAIYAEVLKGSPKLLLRRLEAFFRSEGYSDSVVSMGHLSNAKGNIGEIFALAEQQAIVRALREEHAARSFADKLDLVTDIRIGSREFSDNLIGFVGRGNLNVLGVAEVKNYADPRLGLEKAKVQLFKWLEENIEEGAKLTATYRGQRRTFIYEPGRASGAVKGLYSSKKYLIYVDEKPLSDLDRYVVGFSGRSPIGLDFDRTVSGGPRITFDDGKRTVGQVHVWPVRGVTTAELDYLAALLLRTKGQF